MSFLDKVKNIFVEEVEEEEPIKVEPIKKEVTHVSIESPNAKKDEMEEEEIVRNYVEQEDYKKPVFFDDEDFEDLNLKDKLIEKPEPKIEKHKEIEKSIYNIKSEEPVEKRTFKPTPIISPVYGILDKNYHKEDIVSKHDADVKKESTEPSIDTIRNKAYGTLEDELENTLFGKSSILFRKNEEEKEEPVEMEEVNELEDIKDDLIDNFTDDISKQLDELLERKEKYSSESTEEKKDELPNDDFLGFIDSTLYKDGDEE